MIDLRVHKRFTGERDPYLSSLSETQILMNERLRGDRQGRHSIRVNQQYRICFRWEGGDAYEVEITDYH